MSSKECNNFYVTPTFGYAGTRTQKIYTIYSILFIVFLILIIVTTFITITLTYFQLVVEDHYWRWRSVLCGGSTGVFILGSVNLWPTGKTTLCPKLDLNINNGNQIEIDTRVQALKLIFVLLFVTFNMYKIILISIGHYVYI